MTGLKSFFYLFLLGILMASSFADSGNQDMSRMLSSQNPQERITGLWELQDNNNRIFYTKLIEMVLFDKILQ